MLNRFIVLMISFLSALYCHAELSITRVEEGNEEPEVGNNMLAKEQVLRKERSEKILKSEGVPYLENLPVIESEEEAELRIESQVELRALCLIIVAVKGEGLENKIIEKLIAGYDLANYFTPQENKFLNNPNPTQHEKIQFSWRYESAWVLFWALGLVDSMPRPDRVVDVPMLVEIFKGHSTESFQAAANLRKGSEILDQADLIYRYHWAITDARINDKEPPADLDGGVVYERHYSLNWLIGYMGQDWDEITTDT